MQKGYLRVAAVTPAVTIADPGQNVDAILATLPRLRACGVALAVYPEMCITGYTCADLFHNAKLLDAAKCAVERLKAHAMANPDIWGDLAIVVGLPQTERGVMYNTAMVINAVGSATVRKTYVPNYNEFYERRWWRPAPSDDKPLLIKLSGVTIGIEICEDLWAPIPPSTRLSLAGAQVICNLSASDDIVGKYTYLRSLIEQQSSRCLCGYVYAGAGKGESSTDLVFDGKGFVAECGRMLAEKQRWCDEEILTIADIDIEAINRDRLHLTTFGDCADREHAADGINTIDLTIPIAEDPDFIPRFRAINPHPFVPADIDTNERMEEILHIQCAGLAQRLRAVHGSNLVVGISGGLDSTLALLVAVRTFDMLGLDRKGIVGVTMPGFGTTDRTHDNAVKLMQQLNVTLREISIAPAVTQHFKDIDHDPAVHDVTYENSQARERTQLLMDIANQTGGLVLGTGDLSELALGWATYNGDHMSMYGVNAGVPKTLVSSLVRRVAMTSPSEDVRTTLLDILDTPISPELVPATPDGKIAQKTEDLVGPYELHDFFLYYMLRYGFTPARVYMLARLAFDGLYTPEVILHWLRTFYRRFFAQQFKRSCLPDGPKVGSVCLSPRGDWRMPSDASSAIWLKEVDSLKP